MGCCDEANCARESPLILSVSGLTGRAYVVTLGRELGDGMVESVRKHEVTGQLRAVIKENRAWVLEVLSEEKGASDA